MKKYGIKQIAIPIGVDSVPKHLVAIADIGGLTNAVLRKGNILLESLGFVIVESRKRQIASNFIRI
jgi:hypothetical protein